MLPPLAEAAKPEEVASVCRALGTLARAAWPSLTSEQRNAVLEHLAAVVDITSPTNVVRLRRVQ